MIDKEEAKRIAHLARLELPAEELERIAGDLNRIVEYVEQLQELALEGVEPTRHVLGLLNGYREDEVRPGLDIETALANAPERTSRAVKVPLVIATESSS